MSKSAEDSAVEPREHPLPFLFNARYKRYIQIASDGPRASHHDEWSRKVEAAAAHTDTGHRDAACSAVRRFALEAKHGITTHTCTHCSIISCMKQNTIKTAAHSRDVVLLLLYYSLWSTSRDEQQPAAQKYKGGSKGLIQGGLQFKRRRTTTSSTNNKRRRRKKKGRRRKSE